MNTRTSGIMLHISSLSSQYGIGDLGPSAFAFADLLLEARQTLWQVLPINPTATSLGNSPYNCDSAFAGNLLLISPEILEKDGLLSKSDLGAYLLSPAQRVDYGAVTRLKRKLLHLAFEKNRSSLKNHREFASFCDKHSAWLEHYALFKVLKEHYQGVPWNHFSEDLVNRDHFALDRCKNKFKDQIMLEQFLQFVFFKQWISLKNYCNSKNLRIIGDIPIYVQYDSADVWTNPGLFHLDQNKRPWIVSGVPPDYFSKTGQLWGNPLYNWEAVRATNFSWWIERLAHNLSLFDLVRLDHFRGFSGYWRVPAGEPTAERGEWAAAPGEEFLNVVRAHFPNPPLIAEDLGMITPDVTDLMHRFQIPGMKVLVFAFGEDSPANPFLPHNYTPNCVVYTGTHDNNTVQGWFANETGLTERERISVYQGHEIHKDAAHLDLIRLAMMSVANTVIIPMQDVLGLGEEGRMNVPGTLSGNWEWRLLPEQLSLSAFEGLSRVTLTYGRANPLSGIR